MTTAKQMQSKLENIGLPYKAVQCYGAQIVVTAWSRDAAQRWSDLLKHFATVRGVVETSDDNVVNQNTMLRPTNHQVWRVFARV